MYFRLPHSPYVQPVYIRNWEIQVQFKVTGSPKDLFGDGFAIWYARDRMKGGSVFGSKDYFSGLAVIADTYSNHNGPHNVRERISYTFLFYSYSYTVHIPCTCYSH